MSIRVLLRQTVGDTLVRYLLDETTGAVELNLYPAALPEPPVPESGSGALVPLSFVKFAGDSAGVLYGAGRTMRYSRTNDRFRFDSQEQAPGRVRTVLRDDSGCRLLHELAWQEETPVFRSTVTLENESPGTLEVELLESFSLGGIQRQLSDEEFLRLKVHRFRACWSSEARHESVELPDWQLERDEHPGIIHSERYGQVGTMPVRGFHPFGAVEDPEQGVFWGAQLAWTGSWQLEFSFRCESGLAFGGGLADYEFGHWCKRLAPGETLTAPAALIGCVQGDFDALCARLVRGIEQTLRLPAKEEELPILFNEWCSSWGHPTSDSIRALARKLRTLPVSTLVIDAGWYQGEEDGRWSATQGDWQVNRRQFPRGLEEVVREIRDCGLTPGIWFEAEVVGEGARAFAAGEHLLRDRGRVITVGARRFWNLNDPESRRLIEERVIRFLKKYNFGYVKIDYNETIGVGCDHPDSPGEGLRQQVLGTHWFFRRLAELNPGLVIENCASGGGRLEPAMFALSAMSSFSDAHESLSVPLIAASLHRLMPPRQNQIWAVLRKTADRKRLAYVLSSAMLGRICLSGDLLELGPEAWRLLEEGLAFYRKLVPVLKSGDSTLQTRIGPSRRFPEGGQVLARLARDGSALALYFHTFGRPPRIQEYRLPPGSWRLDSQFGAEDTGWIEMTEDRILRHDPAEFCGQVLWLTRNVTADGVRSR